MTDGDRYEGVWSDSSYDYDQDWTQGTQLTQYGEYDYAYDNIGNRESYEVDISQQTPTVDLAYTANVVNEYTQTDAPETFSHDDDGNLEYDGTLTYTWDAENRLVGVEPKSPSYGDYKYEYAYDYMGRHLSLLRRMAENSTKCLVL